MAMSSSNSRVSPFWLPPGEIDFSILEDCFTPTPDWDVFCCKDSKLRNASVGCNSFSSDHEIRETENSTMEPLPSVLMDYIQEMESPLSMPTNGNVIQGPMPSTSMKNSKMMDEENPDSVKCAEPLSSTLIDYYMDMEPVPSIPMEDSKTKDEENPDSLKFVDQMPLTQMDCNLEMEPWPSMSMEESKTTDEKNPDSLKYVEPSLLTRMEESKTTDMVTPDSLKCVEPMPLTLMEESQTTDVTKDILFVCPILKEEPDTLKDKSDIYSTDIKLENSISESIKRLCLEGNSESKFISGKILKKLPIKKYCPSGNFSIHKFKNLKSSLIAKRNPVEQSNKKSQSPFETENLNFTKVQEKKLVKRNTIQKLNKKSQSPSDTEKLNITKDQEKELQKKFDFKKYKIPKLKVNLKTQTMSKGPGDSVESVPENQSIDPKVPNKNRNPKLKGNLEMQQTVSKAPEDSVEPVPENQSVAPKVSTNKSCNNLIEKGSYRHFNHSQRSTIPENDYRNFQYSQRSTIPENDYRNFQYSQRSTIPENDYQSFYHSQCSTIPKKDYQKFYHSQSSTILEKDYQSFYHSQRSLVPEKDDQSFNHLQRSLVPEKNSYRRFNHSQRSTAPIRNPCQSFNSPQYSTVPVKNPYRRFNPPQRSMIPVKDTYQRFENYTESFMATDYVRGRKKTAPVKQRSSSLQKKRSRSPEHQRSWSSEHQRSKSPEHQRSRSPEHQRFRSPERSFRSLEKQKSKNQCYRFPDPTHGSKEDNLYEYTIIKTEDPCYQEENAKRGPLRFTRIKD